MKTLLVYGIDFESCLTRGSQYRVEGVMCRVTKKLNYALLSATRTQVWTQNDLEFIPFVKEPPKNIFYSPVAVLDFQSLYPSIIIAYNICYSTCLGKLSDRDFQDLNNIDNKDNDNREVYLKDKEEYKKFGCYRILKNIFTLLNQDIPENLRLTKDKDLIKKFIRENTVITPNKTMFVKSHLRQGILPMILKEILLTRIMIKNSMKKVNLFGIHIN